MNDKIKKQKDSNDFSTEISGELSKNGEFVPSCFQWISLDYQKENAKKLQNITKEKKRNS